MSNLSDMFRKLNRAVPLLCNFNLLLALFDVLSIDVLMSMSTSINNGIESAIDATQVYANPLLVVIACRSG